MLKDLKKKTSVSRVNELKRELKRNTEEGKRLKDLAEEALL